MIVKQNILHAYTHTHTHTHSLSLSHSLTHTHTHTHTHSHTQSNTHSHTHAHTLTHTLIHTHTHSYTHSHTNARTHTLTHKRAHTHTQTRTHTAQRLQKQTMAVARAPSVVVFYHVTGLCTCWNDHVKPAGISIFSNKTTLLFCLIVGRHHPRSLMWINYLTTYLITAGINVLFLLFLCSAQNSLTLSLDQCCMSCFIPSCPQIPWPS